MGASTRCTAQLHPPDPPTSTGSLGNTDRANGVDHVSSTDHANDVDHVSSTDHADSAGHAMLRSLVTMRASDAEESQTIQQQRTRARVFIEPKHAIIAAMILLAALATSLTLLVQQAMNLRDLDGAVISSSQRSATSDSSSRSSTDSPSHSTADSSSNTATDQSASASNQSSSNVSNGTKSDESTSTESDAQRRVLEEQRALERDGLMNLNTASEEQLQTIDGIGPVTASRIVEHRKANGPFSSVEELVAVNGIGPKTLAKIKPHVFVSTGGGSS
ncbi:competence protein [Bifidobacterium dolichotidis]|uniref:Competence protein n=1 Tax=Bifidobacterium dolichotidis TaxID=2306976 RepID=A0A430FT77_9BIFI|nr:helix-hairpin-helix domain-containing protein [Bifidobacterium dolichotidis]RSX56104.1 competence protein [Bifidobacterium dolichotidis]